MASLWTYIFVFDDTVGSFEKVKNFLNSEPAVIVNWHAYLPNAFLIVSPYTASSLTDLFNTKLTKKVGRFLIVDTNTDRSGWLPATAWKLMKEPKSSTDEWLEQHKVKK